MNTVKLHQAIAHNPDRTIRELAVIAEMPYNAARRALQILLEQRLVKVAKAVKSGHEAFYAYRLAE